MPHMGGAATAAELLERFPGPPILFTSGYSESTESADSGVVLPSETYSPTSLGRTIRQILDESSHPNTGSRPNGQVTGI